MYLKSQNPHIIEDLGEQRIPLFTEKGAENNRQILKSIAMNGPMLKYDVKKQTGIALYSTVSRRIDDLVERGYLAEASKRLTLRGRQTEEVMYGLTWKGFIAGIAIQDVRSDILRVLRNSPLLDIPEKESIIPLVQEILTREEIETLADSFLRALLTTVPSLEFIENQQMPFVVMLALTKLRLPKGFKLSRIPKDAWELLDRPVILEVLKKSIIPFLKQRADEIKTMYQLVSAFEGFDEFFYSLDSKDQPSKRIKEFLEARSSLLSGTNRKRQRIAR